jgi:hypothetical protein
MQTFRPFVAEDARRRSLSLSRNAKDGEGPILADPKHSEFNIN